MTTKDERLWQVLLFLTSSQRPLTREQLRQAVPDYADAPSPEAFERMFERDKVDLREIGIPLITISSGEPGNQDDSYAIDRAGWELPALDLTASEATVLALATRMWQDGSTAAAARRGLLKLESLGIEVTRSALPRIDPRLSTNEALFSPLHRALERRQPVSFGYRKPSAAAPDRRTVQLWGLATFRSHWYAVGWDTDRGEARSFRLSRIVGEVTTAGRPGAYDIPSDISVHELASRSVTTPPTTAVLRVAPDSGHDLRRRATETTTAPDGWSRINVPTPDLNQLAGEICSYGPAVIAEEPKALRELVQAALTRLAGAS